MLKALLPSPWIDLVNADALVSEMGVTGAKATRLRRAVTRASSSIEAAVGYPLLRARWREGVKGFWDGKLMLTATPIVGDPSIAQMTDPATDFDSATLDDWANIYVEDRDAGIVRSESRFLSTKEAAGGIEPIPLPGSERPLWRATYWGGWIPEDGTVTGEGTISVDGDDQSFNLDGGVFPEWLLVGDVIKVTGFSSPSNNGRFVIQSKTATKVTVAGVTTLVDEGAPSEIVTLDARNLPLDLEEATRSLARFFYFSATRDPSLSTKKVGDYSATFRAPRAGGADGAGGGVAQGFPQDVAGIVSRYVRVAHG